jgi:glycolate oxidase FAD binding subunit
MAAAAALTLEQILGSVESIVGHEHASVREGTIVAAPGDAGQVADVMRFADANRIVVMPAGGGTKLGWGNRVAAGIQLSLRRLTQLREHAWQDLTCTVEAGCAWSAMQAVLAQHGQMVALDPLWPEHATVGGIIAANDSGALRLKYGGLRDLIIGMTIVLADGTIAKSGGKVVKNVAGYDLHKLMTGSFGTLGIIVEVNFRLHPAEKSVQTWTAAARDPAAADARTFAAPLAALMDSQMTPSGVQLRALAKESALDIRMAAPPECLAEYDARIRKIFDRDDMAASGDGIWNARQSIFDSGYEFILKISVAPGELCSIISEFQQLARAEGTDIAVVAQATGLMTVGLNSAHDSAIRIVERMRTRVTSSGGSVVALKVPEAVRGTFDVWGPQSNALPLMREIKRQFDPNRTLNPGRFVGSI